MSGERILVVEDERAVARGLCYALEQEGYDVVHVETGQSALEAARAGDPQLILLDLRLPDISGFDVCRALRAEERRMPILMLTARDEEVDKVLGLELGADDYIVKPYSLRELLSRIRACLRRAYGDLSRPAPGEATTLRAGDVLLDLERLQARRGDQVIDLTPTEFRLLRYLAAHPDRPLTRDQIIEAVWGYESDVHSDRTVDVHVRHLRQKIERDPSQPRILRTVRGVGYKVASELES